MDTKQLLNAFSTDELAVEVNERLESDQLKAAYKAWDDKAQLDNYMAYTPDGFGGAPGTPEELAFRKLEFQLTDYPNITPHPRAAAYNFAYENLIAVNDQGHQIAYYDNGVWHE